MLHAHHSQKNRIHGLPPIDVEDDPDFVNSLARGVAVITALVEKRHMTIAQVAQATGISRAAVRRSLHTLVVLGYVAEDEAGHFCMTPRVVS